MLLPWETEIVFEKEPWGFWVHGGPEKLWGPQSWVRVKVAPERAGQWSEGKWKPLSRVRHFATLYWTIHGLYMDCIVLGILQPRILELVAVPLSRRSSQPRDQTQVSCIAGGFFASWAIREAQKAEELFAAWLCYQRQSIQNSSQRQSIRNTDFVEKSNKAAA